MKVNAALVLQLRNAKSWSQEELAVAAGLNLRTIQRIENEASASLQSKKALAAVFGIDVRALERTEKPVMVKHEYKTLQIPIKKGFLSGIAKTPLPDIESILNAEGAEGWRLVQILTPELLTSWGKASENMLAILERPVS